MQFLQFQLASGWFCRWMPQKPPSKGKLSTVGLLKGLLPFALLVLRMSAAGNQMQWLDSGWQATIKL